MPEFFHRALDAAITGSDGTLTPWLAGGDAGMVVYRNTVAKGRADALAGLFPTVERLVGPDWFRDAALIFAAEHPPTSPVLDDYGQDFPTWLARFEPALSLPYLPPVARMDLGWSRAHRAADAPVLTADDLAGRELFGVRAVLHPTVQLFWFDWTAPSIWLANRPDAAPDHIVDWIDRPEGLVLSRPDMTVLHRRLSRAEWLFLDGCRRNLALGRVGLDVSRECPDADISRLFSDLLTARLFTRLI
ncbi:HvfC/BufC family peptide modification chaperone [Brevundimonas sp.]